MRLRYVVLCCALSCVSLSMAQPAPAPVQAYRIAPGPLAVALQELAQDAGLLFVVDARLTEGKLSPGLAGRYSVHEAFGRLLAGSGLQLVQDGARYSLRPISAAASALAPEAPTASTSLPPVTVRGTAGMPGYQATVAQAALRSDTPLQEVPQSVTVLPRTLIEAQGAQSVAELLRWVPGIGAAQGEGNRDTPVFRGSASTADFLFDGVRDDVQYYRDVYNIERVEVLKGPNAMLLGHGGVGGLINRVGKVPGEDLRREVNVEIGSWAHRRAGIDWNQPIDEDLAVRLNAMVDVSHSYRERFQLRRQGVNPVLAARVSSDVRITAGLEHFEDERTADRGGPSYQGKPLPIDVATFFGNPGLSFSQLRMDAVYTLIESDLGEGRSLSNRTRYADYDKFFQNVFPGAVRPIAGSGDLEVALSAHNSQTSRRNFFNQTDLTWPLKWGTWAHKLLAGLELGRQSGDNWRQTGYFQGGGTTVYVPVQNPMYTLPLSFRASATDPDTRSLGNIGGVYLQDEVRWSPRWRAVLGMRYDRLDLRVQDRRQGVSLASFNRMWSPRAGLVYQPLATLSLYANHSVGYLPRAGEQFTSLNLSNQALQPEKYATQEVGAKWAARPGMDVTAALYQSRRTDVAVSDPSVPDTLLLVDGQRSRGLELGLSGALTSRWQVLGGYAYQEGQVLSSLSPVARAGASLPHVPRHSASIWNRVTLDARWAAGLGVSHRGHVFTSTDNTVTLAGYTRVDAALYHQPTPGVRLQLNIENLFDRRYDAFAHSNNNITPGAPRTFRLGLRSDF